MERVAQRGLQFLLVPDAGAARRVKRALADGGACSGVLVGSWGELLDRAQVAYAAPPSPGAQQAFEHALSAAKGAFWTESLAVAKGETTEAVRRALIDLVSATDPSALPDLDDPREIDERTSRIVGDLLQLASDLGPALPGDLAAIRSVLDSSADPSPPIRVSRLDGLPRLTAWQEALLERLEKDASRVPRDARLAGLLSDCLRSEPRAGPGSALSVLQSRLYEPCEAPVPQDETIQWVGVRDFQQEAEVAAGMVQNLLDAQSHLSPAEIGLLVTGEFERHLAIEDAFGLAGLPVAGLPGERWRRDLGRELVLHFLFCRQQPAPAMALAVCLSSVLMPWTRAQGAVLAQSVMDGDYRLPAPDQSGPQAEKMLALLRGGDSEPASLSQALQDFSELLDGDEMFAVHQRRAVEAVQDVRQVLEAAPEIDWAALRHAASPQLIRNGGSPVYTREGVTIWQEGHEPWRDVRHLFVLGFELGHYPPAIQRSAVFATEDFDAIRTHLRLPVETPEAAQQRARQRFRRQLGAVTDSVTFLVPRRDGFGKHLAPSESAAFMERMVKMESGSEDLIAELDSSADYERILHLGPERLVSPSSSPGLFCEGLNLGRNLLAPRPGSDGKPQPESPSSLEILMLSPLAWWLRKNGATPRWWAPEKLDPAISGNLQHAVFEELFRPGRALPGKAEIASQVGPLLDAAVQKLAPFANSPQWHVEKHYFREQALRAALWWRSILESLGAEVLATEHRLEGRWAGIDIRGRADLILGLRDGGILVVDYKWSKAAKRRERMLNGYDSQASLYREMARAIGPGAGPSDGQVGQALAKRLEKAPGIGVAYCMLLAHECLSDSSLESLPELPDWKFFRNDVAELAEQEIEQRLDELRAGVVALNLSGDRDRYAKEFSITPFALDLSPLVELFAHPDGLQEGA